jgi:hypothetical protein
MAGDPPDGISERRLRCLKCGQKGVAHFERREWAQAPAAPVAVPFFASDGFYLRMRKKRETHLQIVCERCGMTQREPPP